MRSFYNISKNFSVYLVAPLLSFLIIFSFVWFQDIDLSKPMFSYYGDSFFYSFIIKTVVDTGWFFSNSFVGLPHIKGQFVIHDFPIHADSFNILVIKVIALFSSNVFEIGNYYFIFTFCFCAFSAFLALKNFGISNFISVLIAILFAFTPYHFVRCTSHLFLSNYGSIPLSIMVVMWILNDKISFLKFDSKRKICLSCNKYFIYSSLIAIFLACNGVYYAAYSGIIFIFSWFIISFQKSKFFNKSLPVVLFLLFTIFISLFLNYLPAFNYYLQNGMFTMNRNIQGSFVLALAIYSFFIPVQNHFIDSFIEFRESLFHISRVWETNGQSLGVLAAIGLLIMFLCSLGKAFSNGSDANFILKRFKLTKDDKAIISNFSSLNILIILYSTIGGFVIFTSLLFPFLRSHARFSIFVTFLALSVIAVILNRIVDSRRAIVKPIILLLCSLAFFDQTGRLSAQNVQNRLLGKYNSDKNLISRAEEKLEKNAQIFILPITNFTEGRGSYASVIGYLHSKNLRWSYPVMKNRDSYLWQLDLLNKNFIDFLTTLRSKGFGAIMFNQAQLQDSIFDEKTSQRLKYFYNRLSKSNKVISKNSTFTIFRI